jgi:hypothetical protein
MLIKIVVHGQKKTYHNAVINGHLACLEYAYENDCSFDDDILNDK